MGRRRHRILTNYRETSFVASRWYKGRIHPTVERLHYFQLCRGVRHEYSGHSLHQRPLCQRKFQTNEYWCGSRAPLDHQKTEGRITINRVWAAYIIGRKFGDWEQAQEGTQYHAGLWHGQKNKRIPDTEAQQKTVKYVNGVGYDRIWKL